MTPDQLTQIVRDAVAHAQMEAVEKYGWRRNDFNQPAPLFETCATHAAKAGFREGLMAARMAMDDLTERQAAAGADTAELLAYAFAAKSIEEIGGEHE